METKRRMDEISAVLAIVLFYLVLEGMGITCPILYLTGISCAGCGMSRAWLSLLRGDIAAAFYYHPLFWAVVPAALVLFFRKRMPRRAKKALLCVFLAVFIGVYLIRMMSGTDGIVYFRPETGWIARGFTYLTDH